MCLLVTSLCICCKIVMPLKNNVENVETFRIKFGHIGIYIHTIPLFKARGGVLTELVNRDRVGFGLSRPSGTPPWDIWTELD